MPYFWRKQKQYNYESTFYFIFLAALFIAGNMIAIESTERVERKLPLVLKGEVPTTTSRSIPVIPISASVSTDDNIVEIIFTVPLGEVKILVDGQVQEVCQVTAPGQTTSFSIEGWAPGVYKLEFKVAGRRIRIRRTSNRVNKELDLNFYIMNSLIQLLLALWEGDKQQSIEYNSSIAVGIDCPRAKLRVSILLDTIQEYQVRYIFSDEEISEAVNGGWAYHWRKGYSL